MKPIELRTLIHKDLNAQAGMQYGDVLTAEPIPPVPGEPARLRVQAPDYDLNRCRVPETSTSQSASCRRSISLQLKPLPGSASCIANRFRSVTDLDRHSRSGRSAEVSALLAHGCDRFVGSNPTAVPELMRSVQRIEWTPTLLEGQDTARTATSLPPPSYRSCFRPTEHATAEGAPADRARGRPQSTSREERDHHG